MEIKKKSDLCEDEQENMFDELDAKSDALGLRMWNSSESRPSDRAENYGICKDCQKFIFIEYEYNGEVAMCMEFDPPWKLTGSQRISKCTRFDQIGKLSLSQMKDIAWVIDVSAKRAGLL